MMTSILVLYNAHSFFITELPVQAAWLVEEINSGRCPTELAGGKLPAAPDQLVAMRANDLVIIMRRDSRIEDQDEGREPAPRLTARERQMLQALADGLTPKMIASRYGLRPRTVRQYVQVLRAKIGAHTTEHLIARGVLFGLCYPPGQQNHPNSSRS